MTIGQIRELQNINSPNNTNRLFAVGRYQVIPDTLQQAVEDLNLSEDTVFDQNTQDRIGMWLINEKRPAVGAYLSGADVPIDEAMLSLAKEFASVPVPFDTVDSRGRRVRAGQSYYHHFGGNRAGHSVEETRNILMQGREQFDSQRPEGALAPLASLTPQPNPSR
jgi:type VI secretion system secreted protein VgrG